MFIYLLSYKRIHLSKLSLSFVINGSVSSKKAISFYICFSKQALYVIVLSITFRFSLTNWYHYSFSASVSLSQRYPFHAPAMHLARTSLAPAVRARSERSATKVRICRVFEVYYVVINWKMRHHFNWKVGHLRITTF